MLSVYEALTLSITFGMLIVALLAYIEDKINPKNNTSPVLKDSEGIIFC